MELALALVVAVVVVVLVPLPLEGWWNWKDPGAGPTAEPLVLKIGVVKIRPPAPLPPLLLLAPAVPGCPPNPPLPPLKPSGVSSKVNSGSPCAIP